MIDAILDEIVNDPKFIRDLEGPKAMIQVTETSLIIGGILATGGEEVSSRSAKYRTFTHPWIRPTSRFFVGKHAALRYGKCVSKSYVVRYDARSRFIREGNRAQHARLSEKGGK